MNMATSFVFDDPAAILDRHSIRRSNGIPTVSLLVGSIGAGGRAWRCWATAMKRSVIVGNRNAFPYAEWVRAVAERTDLPNAAIRHLAQRAERDPNEFLVAWRTKTSADRERFWSTLAPNEDDDLLRFVAALANDQNFRNTVAASLIDLGEQIVSLIVRLAPSTPWPAVLFVTGSTDDLSAVGPMAAQWAMRVPALPIAVAVPIEVWHAFLTTAPESRAKALLREGELAVPVVDAVTVERTLTEAGAVRSAVAAVAANGADAALVESAVRVIQATATPPTMQGENDRARSAAERFLFDFLESLAETSGRFELNGTLDFHFGPRPVEVDLLCRTPRIALEIDGYFHFLDPACYRRDRTKDWELQRRGYLVLRFLAEDVIPQLELIRDRILDALTRTPAGELT
jgi:Protein of unknown function (DUF559)